MAKIAYSITDEESEKLTSLPLSELYQHVVLGWMEVDFAFFKTVIDRVEPSWFLNGKDAEAFALYQAFYRDTGRQMPQPKYDEQFSGDLLNCEQYMRLDLKKQNNVRSAIHRARLARDNTTKEEVAAELGGWLKARIFHKLLHESCAHYNKKEFKEAYAAVRSNLVQLEQTNFGGGDAENLDLGTILDQQAQEHHGALSFGLKLLDQKLLDTAGKAPGGLLPGDTTILLAPVNVGKTTSMLTVAAHNVALGKKVLTTTHEGRPLDIKTKFWCSLLRCRRQDLDQMWAKNVTVQGRTMKEWQSWVSAYWTYVPMYGKTIEDTCAIVRTLHEEKMSAAGSGSGFHLWVDDYPGTITTNQASQGYLSRRERDEVVYGQVVDLAGELKFHALCAIQSNREGAKINKGTSKDHHNRLLTMEDVSESYGPMMRATNVISINRDPAAMSKGFVTFYICKSRSSRTGIAVTCRSRYDLACTHAEYDSPIWQGQGGDFGGFAYEGTESMSEKAEGFLHAHLNGELSPSQVSEAMSAA